MQGQGLVECWELLDRAVSRMLPYIGQEDLGGEHVPALHFDQPSRLEHPPPFIPTEAPHEFGPAVYGDYTRLGSSGSYFRRHDVGSLHHPIRSHPEDIEGQLDQDRQAVWNHVIRGRAQSSDPSHSIQPPPRPSGQNSLDRPKSPLRHEDGGQESSDKTQKRDEVVNEHPVIEALEIEPSYTPSNSLPLPPPMPYGMQVASRQ